MIALRVRLPRNQRFLRMLDGKAVNFAEREALNGTVGVVQKTAIKAVSDETGIPVRNLRKRGRSVNPRSTSGKMGAFPTKKATRHKLAATLTGLGRPFNLSRFNAKEITAGSSSSIKTGRTRRKRGKALGVVHEAWGRKQVAMGAFRLGKGNRGPVVVPTGSKGKSKRGGLRGAYGPGVTHVMRYPQVVSKIEKAAKREFPRRFASRLRYAFSSSSHIR